MPKQTFKKTRENEEKRGYLIGSLSKLTKGYQQFRKKNSEVIGKQIEDRIAIDPEGGRWFDSESLWRIHFFDTAKGQKIEKELEQRMRYVQAQLAVRVISDQGYYIGMDGKVCPPSASILEDSRFLTLKLDLSQSKEVIKQQIDFFLNAFCPLVKRPPKKRGDNIQGPEEIDEMIEAYNCVEKHGGNHSDAARELYPDISKTSVDGKARIEQLRRWHVNIKSLIQDL